jgi:hypothetical protein
MNEANFASLSPSLLARKGGARPAMRPQLGMLSNQAATAESLEDLGWNDMGADDEPASDNETLQLTPAPANPETAAEAREIDETAKGQLASGQPVEVQEQQAEITRRLSVVGTADAGSDDDERHAEPVAPAPRLVEVKAKPHSRARIAPARGKRAAFTLRLDQERHLKLRLACTMRNRSAQQIVTEALDRLLDTMPELEGLAAQVQRH